MNKPGGELGRITGPVIIALTGLIMLAWSWGTWPDPLVDFGAQLYVPWQLTTGNILYRDVAYYSGPFSCYFNAGMFGIFGVGLHTLVWVNIGIVAACSAMAYRLTVHSSGRLAATVGGMIFFLAFAFGQVAGVGNFNWITPYTHEVCHGTVMGLAAIACMRRFLIRRQTAWLAATGVLLGFVVLTKAEPTVAAIAAVAALLLADGWMRRTDLQSVATAMFKLVVFTMITPVIATVLLSFAMPWRQAIWSELGSWPWTFDHRIASLHFYRAVAGLDDVAGNFTLMLRWCGVYVAVLAAGLAGGMLARTRRMALFFGTILCGLVLGVGIYQFNSINWSGMLAPLPICLLVLLVCVGTGVYRRWSPTGPMQLSLIVFSLALVSKMGLAAKPFHYGFVLAWPGAIVVICAAVSHVPAMVRKRGGSRMVPIGICMAALGLAVTALLQRDAANFASKKLVIAEGTVDSFYGNARAMEVAEVCRKVREITPENGTVEVLPQGLMVNYLTRRKSPTRFTNFMPPEVIWAGEESIVSALRGHPPNVVVITDSSINDQSFMMDGHDPYGAKTLAWVREKYRVVEEVVLPEPLKSAYGFEILVPK